MEDELKLAKEKLKQYHKDIAAYRAHCESCPFFNQQHTNSVHFNHLTLPTQFRNLEENQLHFSHHNDLNGTSKPQ